MKIRTILTLGMWRPKLSVIRTLRTVTKPPRYGRPTKQKTLKVIRQFFLPGEVTYVDKALTQVNGTLWFRDEDHFKDFFHALERLGWDEFELGIRDDDGMAIFDKTADRYKIDMLFCMKCGNKNSHEFEYWSNNETRCIACDSTKVLNFNQMTVKEVENALKREPGLLSTAA